MTKTNFKRIISVAIMLAVMISALIIVGTISVSADGARTPVLDDFFKQIYANGTPIYIVAGTDGGTAIYYMNGSTKVYINPNGAKGEDMSEYSIYGGADGYHLDGDTSITMTGGKIKNIFGAGGGSTVEDESLGKLNGSVNIVVTGGTVTRGIFASNSAEVTGNVTIKVSGGTVGDVHGTLLRTNYGTGWRRVRGSSTVTITGNTKVTGTVFLGDGNYPVDGTRTLVSTVPVTLEESSTLASTESTYHNFLYKNGNTWKVKGSITIPEGATLTIAEGETLSVPSNATLTNNGTIINNGTSNVKGTVKGSGSVTCTNHYYTYDCDVDCNLCGDTRNVSCSANKSSVSRSGDVITVNCRYCGEYIGTITIRELDAEFSGAEYNVRLHFADDIDASQISVSIKNASGETIQNKVLTPGTYKAVITVSGATFEKEFTITKGTLYVQTPPSVSYQFGEVATSKTLTPGKVVASDNSSYVVSGTWSWSGNKAVFTMDDQYEALFDQISSQTVVHNVTAVTPQITISSPSPAMMPGMTIQLGVEVKNPVNESTSDLPASFKVMYKIGNGSLVTVSGTKFTLPTDAVVGDTIYVYVQSDAISGKYNTGKSNTIEIKIGQVDYSADIDRVQTNLNNAIASLREADVANAEELAAAITELNGAIEEAKTFATNADTTLKGQLEGSISTAVAALEGKIGEVQANLDKAIIDLQAADLANANNLTQAVTTLTNSITAAQAAAESYAKLGDEALKADLEGQLSTAINTLEDKIEAADKLLQSNIDAVQKNLDDAVARLDAADAKNAEDLAGAVETLNAAIETAQKAAEAFATEGDEALRSELVKKIEDADKALDDKINQVKADLDRAVEELKAADAKNAEDLAGAVETLNAAIETAQKAAEAFATAGDASLKAELVKKIDDADAILQQGIDKVQENLDTQVERLDGVDKANAEALAQAIEDLKAAINAARAIAQSTAKHGDRELKAELTEKIDLADKTLADTIKSVEKNLEAAKAALEKAIEDGDSELEGKVAALNAALESAKAALDKADADNKAALEAKLTEAKNTLDGAIVALQKKLDDAKAALEQADADNKATLEAADAYNKSVLEATIENAEAKLDEKDEQLTTMSVVAIVLGGLGILGNGGLVLWILEEKKGILSKLFKR